MPLAKKKLDEAKKDGNQSKKQNLVTIFFIRFNPDENPY